MRENLKDKIIFNTLEYMDTGDQIYANLAKGFLTDLAKLCRFTVRKKTSIELKEALKIFVKNDKGHTETIGVLFHSL